MKSFHPLRNPRKILDAALKLVKFRMRSEQDLLEQMIKQGFMKAEAAEAVLQLRELKILDDEALARGWAEDGRKEGHGLPRIRQDLRKRGIPPDIAERALVKPPENPPRTDADRARNVLTRRVKQLVTSGLDPKALSRRLGGHLIRQGFSEKVAKDALDAFFGDKPGERQA